MSVPLKSLLPLVKGQVAPFMLVIPLKSLINAFCHILSIVPKVPERLINGIMLPLTLILLALMSCI